MKLILFIFSLFISLISVACTCLPIQNVKKSFKQSEIIISAQVIEIIQPKKQLVKLKDGSETFIQEIFGNTVKLQLISIYKGKVASKYITISPDKTNCEFQFKVNEKYLVYAWYDNNEIRTNVCTRTSLLLDNKDLKFLFGKYKKRQTEKVVEQI